MAVNWNDIEQSLRQFKKDSIMNYREVLDSQVKQKEIMLRQGTMTQMEKSINKGELVGYKASEVKISSMVPGIFNESPMRGLKNDAGPLRDTGNGQVVGISVMDNPGDYNQGAPPGHWRP